VDLDASAGTSVQIGAPGFRSRELPHKELETLRMRWSPAVTLERLEGFSYGRVRIVAESGTALDGVEVSWSSPHYGWVPALRDSEDWLVGFVGDAKTAVRAEGQRFAPASIELSLPQVPESSTPIQVRACGGRVRLTALSEARLPVGLVVESVRGAAGGAVPFVWVDYVVWPSRRELDFVPSGDGSGVLRGLPPGPYTVRGSLGPGLGKSWEVTVRVPDSGSTVEVRLPW